MRIGTWELRNIRDTILSDLYKKSETQLTERKTEIAKENREYFLEPLATTIRELPPELIAHTKTYSVKIKYEPDSCAENNVVESWVYHADAPIINPVDNYSKITTSSYYAQVPDQTLDPRLHSKAETLCKDILKVRAERAAMSEYLVSTTARESGSLQLRKTWPESLHRFLPAEPVKVPRKYTGTGTQKVEVDKPIVPDSLNIRLTENLLEEL
jgi:hypothetical protein